MKQHHTPAALRLAQIIIPEGIDRRGRASLLATYYGYKTREGIADMIDSETGAPEMLAACKAALKYLEANRPKGNIRKIFTALNEHENCAVKPLRAAIARATQPGIN